MNDRRFWRRASDAGPVDVAAVTRRLNAASELLGVARLVLHIDDRGTPLTVKADEAPERSEPEGPALSAPVTRDGVQVGILHAIREKDAGEFQDTDRWLIEALAAQLSTGQPRFTRRVLKDMRR